MVTSKITGKVAHMHTRQELAFFPLSTPSALPLARVKLKMTSVRFASVVHVCVVGSRYCVSQYLIFAE